MNGKKRRTFVQKAFVVMSSLVLALGMGMAFSSSALANGDHHEDHHEDRHEDSREFVSIGGTDYRVRHDGNGPYVEIGDQRYYLEDNTVVVNGKRYDVEDRGHEDERHRDHERHRDRHEGDHHESDRHEHKD
ncbi:MAG TPA: hypothetical protein VK255_00630 [Patescibacteria group bacterium]|nr:hypothetical protein [Patescibacteria group bacterium]